MNRLCCELSETAAKQNIKELIVMVVDDHPMFRKAVRDILVNNFESIKIVEAGNGEDAVNNVKSIYPDLVIMDISMPQLSGIEATRQIMAQCPDTAILVLTIFDDIEHIMSILQAGAVGYLTKSVFGDELVSAVQSILAGESIIKTSVFKQVISHTLRYSTAPPSSNNDVKLTGRELDVLRLLSKGLSNRDISLKLGLSLRTIKGYMVELLSKLGASSRTEAVIIGLRNGLIKSADIQ